LAVYSAPKNITSPGASIGWAEEYRDRKCLPAASDARNSNNSSEMTEKNHATSAEDWSNGDVEPSIAIQ